MTTPPSKCARKGCRNILRPEKRERHLCQDCQRKNRIRGMYLSLKRLRKKEDERDRV